jgi:hypothetical protein
MDWIYSEYEKSTRLKNILWTVSEDYGEELERLEEYADVSDDLALYYAAKAGARSKFIQWTLVKGYLNYRIHRGANADVLIDLAQICCDVAVEARLVRERPGIVEIREAGYRDLLENFLLSKNNTLMDKVKYLVFFRQTGKSAQMDRMVVQIVDEIEEITETMDTVDILQKVEDMYVKHFEGNRDNVDFLYEEKQQTIEYLERYSQERDQRGDAHNDFMSEEYYDQNISDAVDRISSTLVVESMGETKPSEREARDNRVLSIDEEMASKIYDQIAYYHGKSFMKDEETKSLEQKICRQSHEGCRVHFTDGVLRAGVDNSFQIKYVRKQKENNLHHFNKYSQIHKRNVLKLKETILRTLTMETEVSNIPNSYGEIVPAKLWKVGRVTDLKVFNKVLKNEKGGYVVDIFLDGSGSQRTRQGNVAAQGYIISQALTLAGIPNRVMSFSSFLDYTILRRYRDYDSPESDNRNIFEYYATGNNRDGLAIRAVCSGLFRRPEEHKILIILSDGKPNDIKIAKTSTIRGETSYKGMKAIKDTALEVRKARKNGALVLGVFTGKEEDLYAEKFIYGTDFIYTREVDKFSDIVGVYLKRIIQNYE